MVEKDIFRFQLIFLPFLLPRRIFSSLSLSLCDLKRGILKGKLLHRRNKTQLLRCLSCESCFCVLFVCVRYLRAILCGRYEKGWRDNVKIPWGRLWKTIFKEQSSSSQTHINTMSFFRASSVVSVTSPGSPLILLMQVFTPSAENFKLDHDCAPTPTP